MGGLKKFPRDGCFELTWADKFLKFVRWFLEISIVSFEVPDCLVETTSLGACITRLPPTTSMEFNCSSSLSFADCANSTMNSTHQVVLLLVDSAFIQGPNLYGFCLDCCQVQRFRGLVIMGNITTGVLGYAEGVGL